MPKLKHYGKQTTVIPYSASLSQFYTPLSFWWLKKKTTVMEWMTPKLLHNKDSCRLFQYLWHCASLCCSQFCSQDCCFSSCHHPHHRRWQKACKHDFHLTHEAFQEITWEILHSLPMALYPRGYSKKMPLNKWNNLNDSTEKVKDIYIYTYIYKKSHIYRPLPKHETLQTTELAISVV